MGVVPNDTGHRLQGQLLRRFLAHSLFRRVAEQAHIDFAGNWWRGAEELVFRALRICADCPRKAPCRSWLDEGHPQETYPRFCPNAAIIAACQIMNPQSAAMVQAGRDLAREEPSLAEILDDPIVQQVMEADKIDIERLRLLLTNVASHSGSFVPADLRGPS